MLDCPFVTREAQSFCWRTPRDLLRDARLSATEKAVLSQSLELLKEVLPPDKAAIDLVPYAAANYR